MASRAPSAAVIRASTKYALPAGETAGTVSARPRLPAATSSVSDSSNRSSERRFQTRRLAVTPASGSAVSLTTTKARSA